MGRYVADADVETRIRGKVQLTDDPDSRDRMHVTLFRRLIAEAESEVELDLMPRYHVPFKATGGGKFSTLPEVTKNIIRTLAELQSVMRILETDYGRGTVVNGEEYTEKLKKRYDSIVEKLMKRSEDSHRPGWAYPPMLGLELAYFNTEADDGFVGMPMNISPNGNQASYPSKQINEPSESWWNATYEPDEWK
jgi:hypothetical protein